MAVKILVVDDEPDLEMLLTQKFRRKIREKELQFVFAHDGEEALEKLYQDRDIDLVMTDINMPRMDGLTLLSRLADVKNPVLKAVIVSAYGDMDNIRVAMNRGAFDFLTKPIDFSDLDAVINKTMQELMALKVALKTREQLLMLQQELKVAWKIQQSILPKTFPERKEFEIYGEMTPARHIGGDFFDFFPLGEDKLGFVIGDVSGKGVPAALFMAVSRTLLRATASRSFSTSECLEQVNRLLCAENDSEMFVSMFYGILYIPEGEVEYCSGGHNPPYLVQDGRGVEPLPPTDGVVLGIFEDVKFSSKRVSLKPRDALVLYTDGVTEAMDDGEKMFTERRLEEFLQRSRGSSAIEMARGLMDEVKTFAANAPQYDDITVVTLRYLGP
jgi:phosphoserine phosphatase RsbU/P